MCTEEVDPKEHRFVAATEICWLRSTSKPYSFDSCRTFMRPFTRVGSGLDRASRPGVSPALSIISVVAGICVGVAFPAMVMVVVMQRSVSARRCASRCNGCVRVLQAKADVVLPFCQMSYLW